LPRKWFAAVEYVQRYAPADIQYAIGTQRTHANQTGESWATAATSRAPVLAGSFSLLVSPSSTNVWKLLTAAVSCIIYRNKVTV
jgi:hypothetical protein